MTAFKLFSSAMIAIALLTTTTLAHETSAERYHPRQHASAVPTDHWLDGYTHMPAPSAADSALSFRDQPGGVCDHGDDSQIC